jgi:hypothetical protein
MKLILITVTIITVTIITDMLFFTTKTKNISGTWVLDEEENSSPPVLRIQMAEGYFAGHLDMPEQQVYDRPVEVYVKKNKIKIRLDKNGDCVIDGIFTDSTIEGRSFVNGRTETVRFWRAKK